MHPAIPILATAVAVVSLTILSFDIGRAIRREQVRRRQLRHMQAEIEFMKPLLLKTGNEALAHFLNGDWQSYEKAQRQYNHLCLRWKREITDKLKTP